MAQDSVFKTKTGYCHVLPEKIVLSKDAVLGNMAEPVVGKSLKPLMITYTVIALVFFFFGYRAAESNLLLAAINVALGILLLSTVLRSVRNSSTPVIARKNIRGMEFTKGIKGLNRSYFVIYFDNGKGRIQKRLIILPGALEQGEAETEKALEIMQRAFGKLKGK